MLQRLPSSAALVATVLVASLLAGCTGLPVGAPVQTAAAEGQLREFDLYVTDGLMEPREGVHFFALGFVADPDDPLQVPGPEIRVTEGDTVRVRFHADVHTVHWHGVSVPWAMDGVPYMTQSLSPDDAEDDVYVYEFVARETGTYWYHCHVDAPVHIDLGMFGAFIVEPRDPTADPAFDREATLFLHEADRAWVGASGVPFDVAAASPFVVEDLGTVAGAAPRNPGEVPDFAAHATQGAVEGASEIAGPASGVYGLSAAGPRDYYPQVSTRYRPQYDTFMVNGKSFPDTEPVTLRTGETLRLRLVNAGQLVHTVHLHGHHGLVTHKDGYKLASPYHADTLGMFPGERYDVYVTANNPGVWDLHDHGGGWNVGAYAANDHAFPGGMATMLVYEDFTYAQLPAPEPGQSWTSGDYAAFAPRYRGLAPPDLHRH